MVLVVVVTEDTVVVAKLVIKFVVHAVEVAVMTGWLYEEQKESAWKLFALNES